MTGGFAGSSARVYARFAISSNGWRESRVLKSTFVYSIYIAGSAETVWRALLDGAFTRQYWGHDNVSDWQRGSPWEHRRADGTGRVSVLGEVVEVRPPTRLIVTWADPADR